MTNTTYTYADAADALTRMRDEDAAKAQQARELAAELAIVLRFDTVRYTLGHDYGNGQRGRERARLERELEAIGGGDAVSLAYVGAGITGDGRIRHPHPLTAVELRAAFIRIAVPKLNRINAESYRRHTPATRRTLDAWDVLDRELALNAALGRSTAS